MALFSTSSLANSYWVFRLVMAVGIGLLALILLQFCRQDDGLMPFYEDDIKVIEIIYEQRVTQLKKTDNWVLTSKPKQGLDKGRLNRVVFSVMELRSEREIDPGKTPLSEYGLEPPRLSLRVADHTGDTVLLEFGDEASTDGYVYVRSNRRRGVSLVLASTFEELAIYPEALFDRRVLSGIVGEMSSINWQYFSNKQELVDTEWGWRLKFPELEIVDGDKVAEFQDYLAYLEADKLDNYPMKVRIQLSINEGKHLVAFDPKDHRIVSIDGEIYRFTSDPIPEIKKYFQLFPAASPFSIDFSVVTKITAQVQSDRKSWIRVKDEWVESNSGQYVTESAIKLMNQLASLSVSKKVGVQKHSQNKIILKQLNGATLTLHVFPESMVVQVNRNLAYQVAAPRDTLRALFQLF